jgi:hypothetical protein
VVWIKLNKVMSKRLYFVSTFQDSAIWVLHNRSLAVKKKARGVKHRVRDGVCVCVYTFLQRTEVHGGRVERVFSCTVQSVLAVGKRGEF